MDPQQAEKGRLTLEVAALIAGLPEEDLSNLARAFAVPGGADEFVALVRGLYGLGPEVRAAVRRRLEEQRRFRLHAARTA